MYINGRFVDTRSNGPREMQAKFPGKCVVCADRINVGDNIKYNGKAWHKACPDAKAAVQPVIAAFQAGLLAEGDEVIHLLNAQMVELYEARIARKMPRRPQPTPPTPAKEEAAPVEERRLIEDGRYTIEFAGGDYRTLRVHTNTTQGSTFFGKRVVSFLSGPDNGSDYTGCAFLGDDGKAHLWKRFHDDGRLAEAVRVLEDPAKAAALGLAYALKSNNCWKCGRELTVPASITRGLGPICADKF
jgi:hypothetical protein